MAAARNHAAEIAALAEVLRSVLAELVRRGRTVNPAATGSLAVIDRWLAGEPITAAELDEARGRAHEDGSRFADREKDRAVHWAMSGVGNLAYMAMKPRGWQSATTGAMDAAVYALDSLRVTGVRDRAALEKERMAALARALASGTKVKAPIDTRPRPVRLGDELDRHLGAVAAAHLRKGRPERDPTLRGDKPALLALLARHGYPAHRGVLAFDVRYGGITAGDDDERWLFGAHACLASEAHASPGGPLVPVAYSPNDVIYYLDGDGAAWGEDTIEDPEPFRFADDGDRMMARIQLHDVLFARRHRGGFVEMDGKRGRATARQLGLPAIKQASDGLAQVWGDAKALVIEAGDKTQVGATTKKALAGLA